MYKPNYKITQDILNKIAQIEKLRGEIDNSFILPEREISLKYRASVEATNSSTSIEGNPLTEKEVEAVLAGKVVVRSKYHIKEVENYKKALEYVEKRKTVNEPITKRDILELHKFATADLLKTDKSGSWRTGPVYVVRYREGYQQEVLYTAPPTEKVDGLINRLLDWLKNDTTSVNPLIVVAILHIEFVNIHPFADGNGRVARLLTLLYLGLAGYDFRGTLVPENYYVADRLAYYEAIRTVQGRNYNAKKFPDLTSWIDYFVGGIVYSALEVLETVTMIETPLATRFTKKMSRDQLEILSYVKQFGVITIETATELLPHLNRRTVQRRLKSLVDGGQLKTTGESKNTTYIWKDEP